MHARLRRLGAIAWAVYLGNQEGMRIGHTLLQRLLYFLQYVKGIDLRYRYRLYHYVPYCENIWADLSYLEDVNAVAIEANFSGFGYQIYPNHEIQTVLHFASDEVKQRGS